MPTAVAAPTFAAPFAGPLRCPRHPAAPVVGHDGGFRCTECDRLFTADGPVWDCAPADQADWFADEAGQWDEQAEVYEDHRANDPQYMSHVREAVRRLAARPGEAVLDAGCGTGLTSRRIAGRVGSLTCLDCSAGMLHVLAKSARPHPVLAVRGDLMQLPFADDSFDATLCPNALTQIRGADNRRRVMAELARVTRPGGRVVVSVHALSARKKRLGWVQENSAKGQSGPVAYIYRYERDELAGAIGEYLAVRSVTGASFQLPYRFKLGALSGRLDAALRRLPAAAPWGEMLVGVGVKR